MSDAHTLIDLARARVAELIEKDIATGESPFTALSRGPRSTELEFGVKLAGLSGNGILRLNVRENIT